MKYPTLRIVGSDLRTALLGAAVSLLAACSGESDPESDLGDENTPVGEAGGGAGGGAMTNGGAGGMDLTGTAGMDNAAGAPMMVDCTATPTADGCPDATVEEEPPPEEAIAQQGFENTFDKYCGDCHGATAIANGQVLGGIDYIDDFDALVANGKLVPGDSEASIMLEYFSNGTMPPAYYDGPRATQDEIDQIIAYIDNPAIFTPPLAASCADQDVLTYDDLFDEIQTDLISDVDVDDREFTRYLTLTNRYNSGACAEGELDQDRWAMSKVVNMLSTETRIANPVAINSDETIYRIDIRDYGWDEITDVAGVAIEVTDVNNVDAELAQAIDDGDAVAIVDDLDTLIAAAAVDPNGWDAIVQASAYGVPYDGDEAAGVITQTLSRVPVINADAFLEVAALGDLYYALIGVQDGENLDDFLLRDMNIDILDIDEAIALVGAADAEEAVIDDLVENDVIRAGTTQSQISNQDRVTERRDIENRLGAYWQSFDFEADDGLNESIFTDPFDFAAGGIESIYTLPNGLLGFIIADANGEFAEESDILIDNTQNDFKARTAVSCSGCHAAGFLPVVDQVRAATTGGQALSSGLNADQIEGIEDIYVSSAEFASVVQDDSDRYKSALLSTGVPSNVADPVAGGFIRFDRDMNLRAVAGDLGVPEDILRSNLVLLDPQLGILNVATIDRDDFSALHNKSLCTMQVSSQNRPADDFCQTLLAL